MDNLKKVNGRYAPSPTGPLHLGNLRTALLAWLHARLQGGRFYLRMDDLDQPRVVDGSADQILHDLEWLGLDWDGEVLFQSQRIEKYQHALESLDNQGQVFDCFCSRKDIQQAASAPHGNSLVYSGTCRNLNKKEKDAKAAIKQPAQRIRMPDQLIEYADGCLGDQQQDLQRECGDFVIKRADGLFAYQLAIVVDDLEQEITDIVRGADLLSSTARQLYLMQQLNSDCVIPQYWHVPLMLDAQGERMAKRDGAKSILQWQKEGRDQNQLIGCLAHSVGLIDQALSTSAQELLNSLSFENLQDALKKQTA